MQKRAFVLLSGGLDSTTSLYVARDFYPTVEAVSIDYGQRHKKETDYARRTCDKLGIPFTILPLRGLMEGPGVMLTDQNVEVPNISYSQIQGVSPTYVPFRNGLMLSAITAHAQKYVTDQISAACELQAKHGYSNESKKPTFWKDLYTQQAKDLVGVYAGMHADDGANWAYPDCTPEFLGAMANAMYIGSYNTIRLVTPFTFLTKGQIVEWGTKLGVPYEDTWSCYKGEELHCGTCPTCISRKEAFKEVGVPDPTTYLDEIEQLANVSQRIAEGIGGYNDYDPNDIPEAPQPLYNTEAGRDSF